MPRQVRLLPAVIFLGALTLTLKVGTIWQGVQLAGGSPAAAAGDAKAESEPKDKGDDTKKTDKSGKAAAKPKAVPAMPAGNARAFDPSKATDAELDVLEKLASRRGALEQRGRDLDLRESLLRATETRIDGKIAELKRIRATIDGLLKKHDAQEEAKMKSLVKIYESMKPKDAARIFEQLDLSVLLNVIERMREARAAPILAKMTPGKAKVVTAALATRRALPSVGKKAAKATN